MQYPEAETIHLVMDDLNLHRRKSLTDVFGLEVGNEIWDRFRFTSHPPMKTDSIKRKSKSASSCGNALTPEESQISRRCAGKVGHGIAA